jgi:hypothetical protein
MMLRRAGVHSKIQLRFSTGGTKVKKVQLIGHETFSVALDA